MDSIVRFIRKAGERMAIKKITKRWLFNSFSLILITLIVIVLVMAVSVRSYYYNSARSFIEYRARANSLDLEKFASDSSVDFEESVFDMIQSFSDKSKVEIMALDSNGKVVVSSSGFGIGETLDMPDFETAKISEEKMGEYRGHGENGNILAITYLAPTVSDNLYAIRYVTSLSQIDSQLLIITVAIVLAGACVLLLVIWSSSYFLNSIVTPVGEIGNTAKKIAEGDFESRLTKKNDDEIGELCDAINNMAGELGATEKMKNDFISSVSHELRTPLTAIKGWSETIMSSPDDREITEKGMRVITAEAERLSSMVEELLDFSRMQSGRLTIVYNKMDVFAELEDAVLMYTQKAKRENIELEFNEPAEFAPTIMGDKNRIKQVFVNIIDNAIKYSDAGDKVTVDGYYDDENIFIAVADTGCGIKKSDLPKIKTKFYKANYTRRGSGIGLALADEIVKMHGGTLSIDSEENVGTTVEIKLPINNKSKGELN